ncbi:MULTISPECIES: beta-ketoacyl-ACP synthase I [Marinobacter]|jgi:3-oxoacyl-[acyl-carrier-protein] synthase-1|uniref:3-oxoacyl-[acyl-carrier-protein] synthase 1 n=1 Tax=Marinobacter salarius TaxID=1420917 RepID=A0A1W6K6S0_9GAMM|nr:MULTISPECIES: beta-ketoacyl-ACP synthase I [Marinobacter]ARM83042.1 3-oxoacyl-[acyl-carrier-protein] synthase 1 [Marinobacter salarius]MAB53953.1 beta-ketoacyl-[acyl-carrier-protein] synthase I [Marinobacter sp.]MBJ7301274.1 beta-ketoacyl-ACP synthase I [Marinobacter salarius]MBS8230393.1 beta-ketoacyl-ACP synthase I [Marinobacter salarius]MCC4283771.1 beta-ketoacyl-ACP synthase I [Marinobacter salarius]|tara:strand:- start:3013 stop:4224 length:1212 start_codon:yes stop_codon:yes gene_type:complete|eukprot:m.16629 g.16629  ORF g.16629 m.16629 type:complete len:404 (+) comp3406_c0_seq1:571-1782(+)
MRRVVITGMGIVSSLGTNQDEVTRSLRDSIPGIGFSQEAKDNGLRSHVCGQIDLNLPELIDRKLMRFMCPASGYTYLAMKEAIEQAGLTEEHIRANSTGVITGAGGASTVELMDAIDTHREKGIRRVGPYRVPRTMGSAINASLATAFGITGINYGITSACATSAHSIGHAADMIALGRQDVMFAGGGEDIHWTLSLMFDAMGALSTKYNDTPGKASRTYDRDRDGFVISGGGGILVLEALEHAEARGANILAELVGFGATSDGADMVAPSGEGAIRCMQQAMKNIDGEISYINTHGTSTPAGDVTELKALKETFGDKIPPLSSTKPLCGHALGAAGVHEAIYSLIMQRGNFIAPSANIENLDEGAEGYPIVRERQDNVDLPLVMSNSFGFGGTNGTLIFKKA